MTEPRPAPTSASGLARGLGYSPRAGDSADPPPPSVCYLTVRIADGERFRLFLWELRGLMVRMHDEGNPHASDLERLVDRFVDACDEEDR